MINPEEIADALIPYFIKIAWNLDGVYDAERAENAAFCAELAANVLLPSREVLLERVRIGCAELFGES